MAESSVLDLNYGHLGIASYDLNNSEWAFSRDPQQKFFTELGAWRTSVPPSRHFPTPSLVRPAASVHQATNALICSHANFAPAVDHLANLEIVSAAATTVVETYDATVGHLLSFGTIVCQGHRKHLLKEVAATAMGETGNILHLKTTPKQRYGWEGNETGIWLEAPSLDNAESGYWNEEAAPIQQICFAQTDERSSFLAVRLLSRTVIFQPKYLHRRKPTRSRYFDLPPSTIDPNPILTVSCKETGNVPHAHVTFNPIYQRQFGIIDQRGNWSIWEIDDGYYHMSKHTLKCSTKGSIIPADGDQAAREENEIVGREDGWGRIIWVGDVNTVAVSNRRCFRIFNFKMGIERLSCPELIQSKSADWILDVQKHPGNERHCFVLTSTRLFMLTVTCPSDDFGEADYDVGATVVISWQHYRSTEDITLQMSIQMSTDDDCLVVLYSRVNQLASLYRFNKEPSGDSLASLTSDPVNVNLEGLKITRGSLLLHHIHVDRLNYGKSLRARRTSLGHEYEENGVEFYRLSVMTSDLCIREMLFYSFSDSFQGHLLVEPTSWCHTQRVKPCLLKPAVDDLDEEDAFIVPDGLVAIEAPRLRKPQKPPKLIPQPTKLNPWYIRNEGRLYDSLNERLRFIDLGSTPETEEISQVIENVARTLNDSSSPDQLPLGTLMEYASLEIVVSDIVDASAALDRLLPGIEDERSMGLQRIATDDLLGLLETVEQQSTNTLSLYDTILQNWLAPLSEYVPVTTRQRQERIARRIAAEVILCTTRFHREILEAVDISQSTPNPHGDMLTPPLSSGTFSSQPQSSLPIIAESTPISTPGLDPPKNPLSRLSKHLHTKKQITRQLPPGISQVLTHWQSGDDPEKYSHGAIERVIHEASTYSDPKTQYQREKDQRKKARQQKRQRREDDIFKHLSSSQPQVLQSSPGPMFTIPGSQPGGSGFGSSQGLSQGFFPGLGVQSQVESGKHGSRPAKNKKKKGKSRMSGF
ncbi:unnamed protein product [Periconia digitata]|uniref:RNA polymerase I-specific transcription initiation factor RRN6-like protein n=1 Tax=Periconia digitata TaxID=1303443 RepID=A0A9W4UWJ3_9PLEO|nr:unnamed protein product [Periconia digitata]